MAIQMRRGAYADFDPSKMLPGELAVVVSGDTTTDTGKGIYICFSAGDVQRLSTYEEITTDINKAIEVSPTLQTLIEGIVEALLEAHPEWATTVQDGAITEPKLNSDITTFTQASSRTSLTSGESIKTIWGKISKWFADLNAVAFSGAYTDVSGLTDKTGQLYVDVLRASSFVNAKNPDNGVAVSLSTNPYGNHGLVSGGYYPGDARTMTESDYIEDFQWLLYRDSTGHVTIPRNLTVNKVTSSGSITGSQVGQYTFNAASSGADALTYRLANSLRVAGFELSSAGNVGIYDFTNNKWIFICEPDGSISRIKTQLYCLNTAGDERPVVTTVNDSGAHVAALRSTSTNQLHVYGEFGTANTYKYMYVTMSTSDPRLKENIKNTVINALSIINQIPMHQFDWKTDGKHWDVGLIAPELYEIDPNLAIKPLPGEEDIAYWGVDSFYLTGMLTKAVQELSAENRELKQRLESLEERIARLEGSL